MKNLIYLQLDPYLEQWFRHRHGAGGSGTIVSLTRCCVEWRRLNVLIDLPPEGFTPSPAPPGAVPVEIPWFKGKDPRTYWYLSDRGRKAIEETLLDIFDLELHDYYVKSYVKGLRISYMVIAWMELHGIEYTDTNENAVKKRLDRIRNVIACARRRKAKNDKKTFRLQGGNDGCDNFDNFEISDIHDNH